MTRTFRVALAQVNTTVGDIPGNTAIMLEFVERAREMQADLVAFPEMSTTGYPRKTCFSSLPSCGKTWRPWKR